MRFLRKRVRQRRGRWNTCIIPGCYQKTDHPDGPFCPQHHWADLHPEGDGNGDV